MNNNQPPVPDRDPAGGRVRSAGGGARTRIARRVAVVLGLNVIAAAMVLPAYALTWASSTSPLWAGSAAKGYGNFYNNAGVQAEDSSYQYQVQNGDNGVYVQTDFYFYGPYSSCTSGACWHWFDQRQTPRTTVHQWRWGASYYGLDAQGSAARGVMKVCEDVSWWGDTCSSTATRSFNY